MMINKTQRKTGKDLMKAELGIESLNEAHPTLLSTFDTMSPVYEYEDGKRTDKIIGYKADVLLSGLGVISVKLPSDEVTANQSVYKELMPITFVDDDMSEVNGNLYFRASAIKPATSRPAIDVK
ncbi:hypothetical protein WEIDD23_02050 [Weissella sp. DD23]|uniref:hypothetical protein n=1 Tax=Weissella sp. DD23 TaxID=1777865 RepID=UPI00078283E4|nr:hypothetical protein [Weissella sp. DD23]KXU02660.1 hypothetical protein WEIDD23_02050 [Weissella sp. DD23]